MPPLPDIGARFALAATLVLLCSAAAPVAALSATTPDAAHRCLVVTGGGDTPFGRDFNPYGAVPLDFTSGGIYEPLVIVTAAGGGHQYDWLASALAWSADRKTLTLTVRHGVRWTDGTPLTNKDVVYTLTAGRQAKEMDQIGLLRRGNEVVSVRPVGTDKVAIHLSRVDTTFVSSVLANEVRVVPQHVFAHVKNVGGWLNPHPIGTGPFAVVKRVGTQSYVLDRNPHYWQPGAPHFPCIERIASSSIESAVYALVHGDVDLSSNFIPGVRNVYVAHDPAHFHYYYPANTAPGIGLFFDDTVYPYSIAALRQAISLAIDRKTLSQLAEFGYAPTVDALGINRVWPSWIDKSVAAQSIALATYNPDAARALLLSAGFSYSGTTLLDPRGNPVTIDASVTASWSDWYADWQVIAKNLGAIGIDVNIDAILDFSAWYRGALATKTATLLWNNAVDTESPYGYFKEHLDASSFVPSGESAELTGNWEHFQNAEGTRLLERFRTTADPAKQHRIAARLERLWLTTMPFVPLFGAPVWSTYSTRYFVGFPSASDDYVRPDFGDVDYAIALTRIRPRR